MIDVLLFPLPSRSLGFDWQQNHPGLQCVAGGQEQICKRSDVRVREVYPNGLSKQGKPEMRMLSQCKKKTKNKI